MKDFIDRNIDSPFDLLTPEPGPARRDRRVPQAGAEGRAVPQGPAHAAGPVASSRCTPGCRPYDALAIYAVIAYMDSVAGVFFPKGGMHAVPRALAGAAEKHGVQFRYGTTVTPGARRARPGGRRRDRRRRAASTPTSSCSTPTCRSPTASCCRPRRRPRRVKRLDYSPSLLPAARRLDAGVHQDRPPQHPLRPVVARGLRRAHRPQAADERPVDAGHQPDAQRPVAGAGRQADLLRAVPDARHRPAASTGTSSGRATATSASPGSRRWATSASATRSRSRTSRRRPTGSAAAWSAGAPFAAAHSFFQTGPFRPTNLAPKVEGVVFAGSGHAARRRRADGADLRPPGRRAHPRQGPGLPVAGAAPGAEPDLPAGTRPATSKTAGDHRLDPASTPGRAPAMTALRRTLALCTVAGLALAPTAAHAHGTARRSPRRRRARSRPARADGHQPQRARRSPASPRRRRSRWSSPTPAPSPTSPASTPSRCSTSPTRAAPVLRGTLVNALFENEAMTYGERRNKDGSSPGSCSPASTCSRPRPTTRTTSTSTTAPRSRSST